MLKSLTLAAALAASLVPFAALPADAASSATARASGNLPVYDRPGIGSFRQLVGKLKSGERVHVVSCTKRQVYCEIETLDGRLEGWVLGSYLVGNAAKDAVTPFQFMVNPGFGMMMHP